jgi:hypothetical protein
MRYLLGLLVLLALGITILFSSLLRNERIPARRIPDYSWTEICEIYALEDELDKQVRHKAIFRDSLERVKDRLWKAGMTLMDAADVIAHSASEHNLSLLDKLEQRFGPIPVRERIAMMLLQTLAGELEDGVVSLESKDLLDCYRAEFRSWTALDNSTLERVRLAAPDKSCELSWPMPFDDVLRVHPDYEPTSPHLGRSPITQRGR